MFVLRGGVSLAALMLAAGFVGIVLFTVYRRHDKNHIILIVGTSSSGKTAIINELQKKIDNYRVISLDAFNIDELYVSSLKEQAHLLGWDTVKSTLDEFMDNYVLEKTGKYPGIATPLSSGPLYDIQNTAIDSVYVAFFVYAKQESQKGNIIIDTVFDSFNNYDQVSNIFHDQKMIKVLVYCPLDVIQERVEKRNLSGKPEEQRTAWQAFTQFGVIYKVQDSSNDQIVDTIAANRIQKPLIKAIDDFIAKLQQNKIENEIMKLKLQSAVGDVRQFYSVFIQRFKLDNMNEIVIVPIHHYDLILDSVTLDPEKNAQKIIEFLRD